MKSPLGWFALGGIGVCMILLLSSLVHANTPGQHGVALSWTDNGSGIAHYNIYRGLATGVCSGAPTPYASTNTNSTNYTDASVTAGTTYFYAVSAVTSTGAESACSSEAQATVPTSPVTPTGLQGTAY